MTSADDGGNPLRLPVFEMCWDNRRVQSNPSCYPSATTSHYSELGHALDEGKIGSTSKEVAVSSKRHQTTDGVFHRDNAPTEVAHTVHLPLTSTSGDYKLHSGGVEALVKEYTARDEPKPMAGPRSYAHDYLTDLRAMEAVIANEGFEKFVAQLEQSEVSRPSSSQMMCIKEVPQKRYKPKSRIPFKPFILFEFVPDMNDLVWLSAALKEEVKRRGLHKPVYKGKISQKASIQILWPGYTSYTKQVNVRTSAKVPQSITIMKLAKEIAKQVKIMIEKFSGMKCTEPGWELSPGGSITFDQIVLLGVKQVSKRGFQPVLAVLRQD
ncbi:uncharacterized protein LAESUDRAFT_453659 [Laetiporus sulphureus 93-53]|uniref:Uncharacterized protein n=1 Tax=Laetiporus sulphureus 93-53 TaxID=1314785 RepID=A0A165BUY1_9APHY|nr:uncharacterized protein LAESUDRAFT_453659 [Laetiporus sulphureus 93-53]KZT01701.1 hypothetical protein LAESUDRAFT_453659 [Laetiporus sulphureus 93-53]